jgi:hypothetical protein
MGNFGITILDIALGYLQARCSFGKKYRLIMPVTVVEYVPRWIGRFIPSVKYVHNYAPTIEEFHQRPFDAVMRSFVSCPHEPQVRVYLICYRKQEH